MTALFFSCFGIENPFGDFLVQVKRKNQVKNGFFP